MKILIATSNPGKKKEYFEFLKDLKLEILSLADLDIKESFKEKGRTFEENAFLKAYYAYTLTGFTTIGEDSGLLVPYLDFLPGIYSRRFSESGKDEDNRRLLLDMLKGVPFEKRRAKFVCVSYLFLNEKEFYKFKDEVEGFITYEERGKSGFGYDPIFLYPPLGRTFAEMDIKKKNEVSHRGKVLRELKNFLQKIL
ncbi:MAG: RdgB/HAM1 family non-canonical purine NTP pyrophosphatase [Candidatus Hydrothermales bacterium]